MNKDRECLKEVERFFSKMQENYMTLTSGSPEFRQIKDYVDQTLQQEVDNEVVEKVEEAPANVPVQVDLSGVTARLTNIESELIKLLQVNVVEPQEEKKEQETQAVTA